MKKLLSILLALVMVMTFALPAMAAEETTYDVQITSDIRVDEAYRTTGDGVYLWEQYGILDAIVAGKELKNITVSDLRQAICEAYGIDVSERFGLTNQDEPWVVGQKYPVSIQFVQWVDGSNEPIVAIELFANVLVEETVIESISAEPITLYAGVQNYKEIEIVTTYKNGVVEKRMGGYSRDWEWPTELGTYTKKIYLNWGYEIPVTIHVVEVPTSGKCGENLTWKYDAATKTLTISGTGAMYEIAKDLDAFWEYDYSYEPEFWYCGAEHIVVEEGVTSLPSFAFGWLEQKTLKLPSTLKEIPQMWLTVSTNMDSLVIPEGITTLTGWPFGSPGNSFCAMKEIHLPSTLVEMDIVTILTAGINSRNGSQILETIYFAGTEAQWNAIKRVRSGIMNNVDDEAYAMFVERFSDMTVVCTGKEEIPVENGTVTIPDSSVKVEEGKDVVIDVTDTTEKTESVIIGAETVDKIADAETSVEIKLPDATVSFDKTAIGSVNQQAGNAAVTIVAKEVKEETLSDKQTAALKDQEVLVVLSLEAKAGETNITSFGGGKVTVSVPFELPQGKKGEHFYVAYVAADGTLTPLPTTYANGMLRFETTHFSNYVVLDNTNNPKDGDSGFLLAVLLMVSTGIALVCTKRKVF